MYMHNEWILPQALSGVFPLIQNCNGSSNDQITADNYQPCVVVFFFSGLESAADISLKQSFYTFNFNSQLCVPLVWIRQTARNANHGQRRTGPHILIRAAWLFPCHWLRDMLLWNHKGDRNRFISMPFCFGNEGCVHFVK